MSGVHVHWQALAADDELLDDARFELRSLARTLAGPLAPVASELVMTSPSFALVAALGGTVALRADVPVAVAEKVGAWIGMTDEGPPGEAPRALLRGLGVAGTLRGAGIDVAWPRRVAVRVPELLAVAEADERAAPTVAMLAVELDVPSVVASIYGAGDAAFAPGRTFGFDLPGFVHHAAAAASTRAAFSAFEPAWDAFLRAAPRKLAAGTLEWQGIVAAARVVTMRIERAPEAEIVERLHTRVARLAAEGA